VDVPQTNGQRRGSLDGVRKERMARKERDKTTRRLRQIQWALRARARIHVPRFGEHVLCKTGKGDRRDGVCLSQLVDGHSL
jgi:hypothetical protein